MEAKYAPADLSEIFKENNKLKEEYKSELYDLLKKYESLFNGTLGKWKGKPFNIELKEGAKPYHARP